MLASDRVDPADKFIIKGENQLGLFRTDQKRKLTPKNLLGEVIVTTTDQIDGMKIVAYKGLVHYRGNVLNTVSYENELAKLAVALGANAVVGVKVGGDDPVTIMFGTAVVVEKL